MINRDELCSFLEKSLDMGVKFISDPSNNGLQVEGTSKVKKIIFAVDASLELFQIAKEEQADFIFTHHGISWGGGIKQINGNIAKQIKILIQNDISLFSVHLPLDAHCKLGHNAQLANMINLKNQIPFSEYANIKIGVSGESSETTPQKLLDTISSKMDISNSRIFGGSEKLLSKIGIVSGGAGQSSLQDAVDLGLDCLITGEVGHSSYHFIKENDLSVIGLGHYSSEQPGIFAVMNAIDKKYNLDVKFVDIPTGL